MNYYLEPWKKYATFSGRARRKEYWIFWLVNFLISLAGQFLTGASKDISALSLLFLIYGLATIIPGLAVTVRRLHDTNRSGWWYFIAFIPIIGIIWILVLLLQDSQAGDNKYGPNPKGMPKPEAAQSQPGGNAAPAV